MGKNKIKTILICIHFLRTYNYIKTTNKSSHFTSLKVKFTAFSHQMHHNFFFCNPRINGSSTNFNMNTAFFFHGMPTHTFSTSEVVKVE